MLFQWQLKVVAVVVPTQLSMLFQWQIKVVAVVVSFLLYICIVFPGIVDFVLIL